MSIKVEKFPDIHAVLITMIEPLTVPQDALDALAAGADFKREMAGRICRIMDFSHVHLDLSSMMVGMTTEKGHEGGLYDVEVATVFIGSGPMVDLGVNALKNQAHYKGANVAGLVRTREEALEIARRLAEET